jgi:hypothetical protein
MFEQAAQEILDAARSNGQADFLGCRRARLGIGLKLNKGVKIMASIEVKSFAADGDVNEPNNARVETLNIGGQRVMKLTLKPGWKWSEDIKPTVGTESCQAQHLGVVVKGTVAARHDDGTEMTYTEGDAYSIAPGHDGWVIGDGEAVVFEFHGAWGD